MEKQTPEERRIKRNEYLRKYRATHPEYDKKQRAKPEYYEREKTRLRLRYHIVKRMKEYEIFKEAMPNFLTI
jgi:hypothetical protein